MSQDNWEREALTKIALAGIQEQRRARRWGVFFKLLGFGYLFLLLIIFMSGPMGPGAKKPGPHTALVDIQGVISESSQASADLVTQGLRQAFRDKNTVAVMLRVNSPGGSPVQSAYINNELRRLKAEHPDTPVYAVISDVGASGGYYAVVSADYIYADASSVVGSIGVRMDGFGLVEAIDKLGIERRLMTAGENKGLLDPFLPVDPREQAHVQRLLDNIHAQFVDAVKTGRGDRLKGSDEELFNGLIWTGDEALALGIIDGLGSPGYVAREVIGQENIVDFTPRQDIFRRLADSFGAAMGRAIVNLSEPTIR
ncbi:S49 family peptidase [Thioalkalivibrio sulfidiphilus]|uniref:Peptidase S49 n=1 Tax=Thioalkalivibrio sulfidiphilus (strain HL-EbGR7) TaxID=396588 RepID=B8GR21_THISH|nr:S49 family peptidase [Thioalkalivibrio sulfidiphilus]ACL72441.1 peptidase S49 [Thioalkalivibrio sulfidiphilus HL-EbGr7]